MTAGDFHAVLELFYFAAHAKQVVDDGGNAIGFFHAQFLGITDDRFPLRQGRSHSDDRNFIDEIRNFDRENFRACQCSATNFQVAHRFAILRR